MGFMAMYLQGYTRFRIKGGSKNGATIYGLQYAAFWSLPA